jgi:hypothetical protein
VALEPIWVGHGWHKKYMLGFLGFRGVFIYRRCSKVEVLNLLAVPWFRNKNFKFPKGRPHLKFLITYYSVPVTFFVENAVYWVSYFSHSPGNEVSTRWTPYAPPGNPKIVQEDHPIYCLDCPCLMAWVRLSFLTLTS